MEKIKQKPFESFKSVLIILLVITMLVLASFYIGGAQLSTSNSALNSKDMPGGTVEAGGEIPDSVTVYEKNLLLLSYIGVRCDGVGGGAYGSEQAANDLFEFAREPLHHLLSSSVSVQKSSAAAFEAALEGDRYICIEFASALPYQILYTLTGEYNAPFGSDSAINPKTVLISFDGDGNATLYMYCENEVYSAKSDYALRPSELLAMASDSRLGDFYVTGGSMLSESAPLVQTLSLSKDIIDDINELNNILSLLDYDAVEDDKVSQNRYTFVAPHGTLSLKYGKLSYTAGSESGIPMSLFLDSSKSDLDMDIKDVLLSAVSLTEQIRAAAPGAMGGTLDVYLDGFYRKDDVYTVEFVFCEGGIPVFGEGLNCFAKIMVQGGRLKELDVNLVSAEKSGYTYSPFSSAWEYRYASIGARVESIVLRYNIVSLPCDGIGASWCYTGERTVPQ